MKCCGVSPLFGHFKKHIALRIGLGFLGQAKTLGGVLAIFCSRRHVAILGQKNKRKSPGIDGAGAEERQSKSISNYGRPPDTTATDHREHQHKHLRARQKEQTRGILCPRQTGRTPRAAIPQVR
jgi:hypothetical protein